MLTRLRKATVILNRSFDKLRFLFLLFFFFFLANFLDSRCCYAETLVDVLHEFQEAIIRLGVPTLGG